MLNITEIMEDKSATARGRREGREIKLSDKSQAIDAAAERAEIYRRITSDLQRAIEFNSYGLDPEELEQAELVLELLENLALYTYKSAVIGR